MSALKQSDVFSTGKRLHRSIASEIGGNMATSRGIPLAVGLKNHPHQQSPIIRRKPGGDEELPSHQMLISSPNNVIPAFQPGAVAITQMKGAKVDNEEQTGKTNFDEDDKIEFKLIKGMVSDKDVEDYVSHRNQFFGSKEDYLLYSSVSDAEFDADKDLRGIFDYKGEKGRIIYRWTRKAYEKKGVNNVPELIKHRESKEFKIAFGNVRKGYGKDFPHGGFNPRPMKNHEYKLRLGTISNHGFGNAVDVDDHRNPI